MTDTIAKPDDMVALKILCVELEIDAREARQKLRIAVKDPKKFPELAKAYQPRQPWQWAKDSPAFKEAHKALSA